MPKVGTKKGGGAKLSRTETVTVRLDPRLRYLAEIGSRSQRRTLSSFIEWAIEESLSKVLVYEPPDNVCNPTEDDYLNERGYLLGAAEVLWDVDEADRFAQLAIRYPELLTFDEQVLWKLIRESKTLWEGGKLPKNKFEVKAENFNFQMLRKYWDEFVAVAQQEKDPRVLPGYE